MPSVLYVVNKYLLVYPYSVLQKVFQNSIQKFKFENSLVSQQSLKQGANGICLGTTFSSGLTHIWCSRENWRQQDGVCMFQINDDVQTREPLFLNRETDIKAHIVGFGLNGYQ